MYYIVLMVKKKYNGFDYFTNVQEAYIQTLTFQRTYAWNSSQGKRSTEVRMAALRAEGTVSTYLYRPRYCQKMNTTD